MSYPDWACLICGSTAHFAWTDTHGIAQCFTCGAPYRLYHYEGDGEGKRRVDKPPELQISPEYVQPCVGFWRANKRRMPGAHSFPGGQELATCDDCEAFSAWLDAHGPKLGVSP